MRPILSSLLITLLLPLAARSADDTNTPAASDWQTELNHVMEQMGITLDVTNTSRAALLASVQTVDHQADILTDEQWASKRDAREGRFLLPGFRLGITNGLPVIIDLPTNSPAAASGLQPGDLITGIGTQQFAKISLPDMLLRLKTDAQPTQSLRYVRAGLTNWIELVRSVTNEPSIETVELLPNQIGYIKINGLYPGSGRDVVSRVRAWSENNRDGIVLDLRGAGGFDAASVMQVASLFSRSGQFLFAFRDHLHQDLESFRAAEGNPVELPVMVLIDRETHGAAEVLAAVINGSAPSALLIGEPTAGDFMLRDAQPVAGQQLYFTTRVLNTADGLRYTGQHGLDPAIPIGEREKDTRDYEPPVNLLDRRATLDVEARDAALRRRVRGDGALERAVDMLIGLKSLNKAPGEVFSEP